MENKSTFDNAIALTCYCPDTNSLAQAFDLCQGLQGIPANTQILNKPKNISWRDTNRCLNSIQRIFLKGEK